MAIFSSPSIGATFNASAPPDDGSQTSANEVTWAKIKTKLADPIKSYVDSVVTDTSSAFRKVAFSDVATKSADYTVTTSDSGKLLSCTNSITITLLDPSSAGNGFSIFVSNDGSGTIVVSGGGYGTLWGSAALNLLAGDAVILTTDESNWQGVVGHRAILRAAVAETITANWTFSGNPSFTGTPTFDGIGTCEFTESPTSSASADSGYTRVDTNFCRRNTSFTSFTALSSGDNAIAAPSGATHVLVSLYCYAAADNSGGLNRYVYVSPLDTDGTTRVDKVGAEGFEFTAQTTGQLLVATWPKIICPVDGSGNININLTPDGGGQSGASYGFEAYWD